MGEAGGGRGKKLHFLCEGGAVKSPLTKGRWRGKTLLMRRISGIMRHFPWPVPSGELVEPSREALGGGKLF